MSDPVVYSEDTGFMSAEDKAAAEAVVSAYAATHAKLVLTCLDKVPDVHRWYVKIRMQEASSAYSVDEKYQRSKT